MLNSREQDLVRGVEEEDLYRQLWMVANFRGPAFVRRHYPSLCARLGGLDPWPGRAANELLLEDIPQGSSQEQPRPEQTIMVVGSTGLRRHAPDYRHRIYQVNLVENDPQHYAGAVEKMDLVHDIGDAAFFQSFLPRGHFRLIVMEHIPLKMFLSTAFFRLARYLLQPGGTIRTVGPPDHKTDPLYHQPYLLESSLRRMVRNKFTVHLAENQLVSPTSTHASRTTVMIFRRVD